MSAFWSSKKFAEAQLHTVPAETVSKFPKSNGKFDELRRHCCSDNCHTYHILMTKFDFVSIVFGARPLGRTVYSIHVGHEPKSMNVLVPYALVCTTDLTTSTGRCSNSDYIGIDCDCICCRLI